MKTLMLYTPTTTNACGYLPGLEAQSQYVDPRLDLTQEELTLLSQLGFRRSGKLVYRPECPTCNACVSVRIPVNDFMFTKSMKRTLKKSMKWQMSVSKPQASEKFYRLFDRYISERHIDGDMYPANQTSYEEFLTQEFGNTYFLNAELQGELIGVMVFDLMDDGLSSVYCFFDPAYQGTAIGSAMILKLTQLTKALNKEYNYLGYWVQNCRKMEYKAKYRPLEGYVGGKWQLLGKPCISL